MTTEKENSVIKTLHAERPLLVGLISEHRVPEQWKVEEYRKAILDAGGKEFLFEKLNWYQIINDYLPRIDLLIVDASSTEDIENVIAVTTLAVVHSKIPVLVVHDSLIECSSFYFQFEISRTGKKELGNEYPMFPKFRKFFGSIKQSSLAVFNFVNTFKDPQCAYYTHGIFPEIDFKKPIQKTHEPVEGC